MNVCAQCGQSSGLYGHYDGRTNSFTCDVSGPDVSGEQPTAESEHLGPEMSVSAGR